MKTHARAPHKIGRRNQTDAKFVPRYYTDPYAKYRSESIKQMVHTRKEPGRANEICDTSHCVTRSRIIRPSLNPICFSKIASRRKSRDIFSQSIGYVPRHIILILIIMIIIIIIIRRNSYDNSGSVFGEPLLKVLSLSCRVAYFSQYGTVP